MPKRRTNGQAPALLHLLRNISPSDILPYLSKSSLLALRQTAPSFYALLLPFTYHLFNHVGTTLSRNTFSKSSLAALERIGKYATKFTLTLKHTPQTRVGIVARNPREPHRLTTFVPLPRDGAFSDNGAFTLQPFERECMPADPHLFRAVTRIRGWMELFTWLNGVSEIELLAPGACGMEWGTVDEALRAMRSVWEAKKMRLRSLVWEGHAGGVWMLDPRAGWEGQPVKRAWWAGVERLVVRIDERSLNECESWEPAAVARAIRGMVEEMAEVLVEVTVEAAGLESPFVGVGPEMARLVEMEVGKVVMHWEEMRRFLNVRARNVVRLATGRGVVFREQDEGWEGLFREWELENVPVAEWGPFVLRRKDTGEWRSDGEAGQWMSDGGEAGERASGEGEDRE